MVVTNAEANMELKSLNQEQRQQQQQKVEKRNKKN
jgi:hypothetical protein